MLLTARAKAAAIGGEAAGLGLPPLIATVIAAGGWRDAYLTLAVLTLVPLLLLLPGCGTDGAASALAAPSVEDRE